jgi:colicin import membrane protein
MSLSEKPGFVVSGAAHVALLVASLLSLSHSPKFQDMQETIPVSIVSASDVNQIMKGIKTAEKVRPKQRVDKIADTQEMKPKPPLAEAKRDVPTPPLRAQHRPDPGHADKPPPKPVEKAELTPVAPPPPKPEAAKPAPKTPTAMPMPPDDSASEPLPVPRPKFDLPKKEAKKEPPKKEMPKKTEPKLQLDKIAKLLDQKRPKEPPKPARQKSGEENADRKNAFDPDDISSLLSHEKPQRKASTGRQLEQVASLGSPTASAPRMSPSLQAEMEGWFQDRFQGCWTQPITLPPGPKYVPEIRVPLNIDGSLAEPPTLINPPDNPAWRPLAESALRAIRECNPLPVPARFKPYYDEWRGRIVRFEDDTL